MIVHADCLEHMRTMDANSVDAIVTDPPYGLSFMGKGWDKGVPGIPFWSAALAVLKPGGYLLAFGGTRTSHRMAVAIEDAGFEIRDSIAWLTGQGFPKSLNVNKALESGGLSCQCGGSAVQYEHDNLSRQDMRSMRSDVAAGESIPGDTEQDVRPDLQRAVHQSIEEGTAEPSQSTGTDYVRGLRDNGYALTKQSKAYPESDLLSPLQRHPAEPGTNQTLSQWQGQEASGQGSSGIKQSGVEGRGNLLPQARQLQADQVRPVSGGTHADVTEGRLCDGASPDHGADGGLLLDALGSSASHRPRSTEQRPCQPRIVADKSESQARGAWPICDRCDLPIIPDGLGTALKPGFEPILVCRKPLAESTVAANVLTHGTGAINIDACRIEGVKGVPTSPNKHMRGTNAGGIYGDYAPHEKNTPGWDANAGRWPANVILDEEAAALLDEQSGERKSGSGMKCLPREQKNYGIYGKSSPTVGKMGAGGDTGGASRFFYTAKASRSERNAGLEGMPERISIKLDQRRAEYRDDRQTEPQPVANHHPTVKPIALMRWLVRLVTPPGGIVLDPFAGSGTTGCAASLEGFQFIGIEREAEYIEIAERRIAHWSKKDDQPRQPELTGVAAS